MKRFRIAWSQLRENRGMALLIALELLTALVIFNGFASQFGALGDMDRLYRSLPADMQVVSAGSPTEGIQAPSRLISVGRDGWVMPEGQDFLGDYEGVSVLFFQPAFFEKVSYPLVGGSWMKNPREGCVNVIVSRTLSRQYRLGETYTFNLHFHEKSIETQPAKIYVCGVLSSDAVLTGDGTFDTSGKRMLALDCMGLLDQLEEIPVSEGVLLPGEMPLPGEEISPLAESLWADQEELMTNLRLPAALAVATACFCIAAFLGYSLLSQVRREKSTAVYLLCGASLRDIEGVKLLHDALLVLPPMLLSLIILAGLWIAGLIRYLSPAAMVGSYLGILLIFALVSLLSSWRQSRRSPILFIRRWL